MPVQIGASKVLLIDTPGFDDTTRTDSEILSEIARILSAQYQLGVELKGVVYIHRITDIRYTRTAVKTFEIFRKICGDKALSNVLLATSRWSEVDQDTGSGRERQLKDRFWAYMLAKGSKMSRFHGDRDSAIALVSQLLCEETIVLDLQRELVDQGKKLDETIAGTYVNDNLEKLKEQYKAELEAVERLKEELQANDRRMKRKIQQDWEEEQARLKHIEQQQVSLKRPVGVEVGQTIDSARRKNGGLSKVLPFVPAAVQLLALFAGIPPGVTDVFTSWFSGMGFDLSMITDLIGG